MYGHSQSESRYVLGASLPRVVRVGLTISFLIVVVGVVLVLGAVLCCHPRDCVSVARMW